MEGSFFITSETSKLVPPASIAIRFWLPSFVDKLEAPTTPPAGPELNAIIGVLVERMALLAPPEERVVISLPLKPLSLRSCSNFFTYSDISGLM